MKRYQNFGLLTKKKASKFRCFLFLCERECMRYRVRKPRFAPLHIATAPLCTLHILVMPFVAFRSLYTNLPNAEAIHLFRILGWIPNHLFRCWTLHYKISQGVPSGRLPRYARNDIKCVARNSIRRVCKVCYYFFSKQTLITFRTKYSVIASVAWQSPGREPYEKTALSDGFCFGFGLN